VAQRVLGGPCKGGPVIGKRLMAKLSAKRTRKNKQGWGTVLWGNSTKRNRKKGPQHRKKRNKLEKQKSKLKFLKKLHWRWGGRSSLLVFFSCLLRSALTEADGNRGSRTKTTRNQRVTIVASFKEERYSRDLAPKVGRGPGG